VLVEELDFDLPPELIAQRPVLPRDACRLMHLTRDGGLRHLHFRDLPNLLRPGDLLVLNDSRVLPARVNVRKSTGGRVELLFLRQLPGELPEVTNCSESEQKGRQGERWETLAHPSSRLRPGLELFLPGGEPLRLVERQGQGRWIVEAPPGGDVVNLLETYGLMPLPPYIKTYPEDPTVYQTVYAAQPGSAAAPTAGLHFTAELLERLKEVGVRIVCVTLHVGLDTFLPIREKRVEDHRIHSENYSVSKEALSTIKDARSQGARIVAVGTTVVRVLETVARAGHLADSAPISDLRGSADLYITPGYHFTAVDMMLTNLHLPRSTVLALTMAFAGVERLREAYAEAVRERYRFFSFGDAMLIEKLDEPRTKEARDADS